MILPKSFYENNTLKVAQDLLGCFLVFLSGGKSSSANGAHANECLNKYRIVETEAYCGPHDLASHASRGETERNKVMFGEAGIIYVYLIYGMYNMLNIVTEKNRYPAAVLIRALEPLPHPNLPLRKGKEFDLSGPGKLTKNLKIDRNFNSLEIYKKNYGLWIEEGEKIKSSQIKKVPRVGVDYAGEYKDKLWRFYIKDNKFVSKR